MKRGLRQLSGFWRPLGVVVALLLSACASPLIRPGAQSVDGLQLTTPIEWTTLGFAGERLWTRDGPSLNALRFYTDIQPGEQVFRQHLKGRKDEGARFRAGMSAIDIQDLIVEGLRESHLANVQASGLRPAKLQGRTGFRADLDFDSPAGLHYRAMLLGEGEDDSLSFVLYSAPAEYYFERDQAAVDAIFASLGG